MSSKANVKVPADLVELSVTGSKDLAELIHSTWHRTFPHKLILAYILVFQSGRRWNQQPGISCTITLGGMVTVHCDR